MKWVAKAAVQGTISLLPRSHEINYVFQKHVTKRLPRGPEDFDFHAATAATHLRAVRAHRPDLQVGETSWYEFGAGWDLIGALALWSLGVERQVLVDIRDNLRLELVNHTIEQFHARRTTIEAELGEPLRPIDPAPIASSADLEHRFGIRYLAPCDARATGLPDRSIDIVTSTFTLEHIPGPDIEAILAETRRLLAPAGIMSSLIDLQDHFSYIDHSLSPYHFLRYGPRTWTLLNPGLQWQSRLRYPAYLACFEAAGWDILADEHEGPTAEDFARLDAMPIHDCFKDLGLSHDELGVRSMHLIADVNSTSSAG